MDVTGGQTSASPTAAPPSQHGDGHALHPEVFSSEDILFCIDVGPETMVEMKVNGPNGRPCTRLDSIKKAILLFINAKLIINSDHRFAFAALAKSTYWILLYCKSSTPPQFQLPTSPKIFTLDVMYPSVPSTAVLHAR